MAAGDPIYATDYAGIRSATIDAILCRVRQTVVQPITSGTPTGITMDVEDFDPFNIHNPAANTSRITPTTPGYYRFDGGVYLGSAGANAWDAAIAKNGTAVQSGARETLTGIAGRLAGATLYMNGTTDYAELQVNQGSGAAVNTNSSSRFSSWLECRYTGRATNP